MTELQYQLADMLLKYMLERPFSNARTISDDFFYTNKCELNDLHIVLAQLQRDTMIISYPGRNLSFTLSNEGIVAARVGYKSYVKSRIDKEQSEVKRGIDQYKWNKQTLIIATLSLIVGLLSILISLFAIQR